jgi:hypothetical protein
MGCRYARSLRIQQRASNEVFTLSPATHQWLDWAWSAPAGRAPEIRPASCPAIPQGAVIRRARAPAEGFPAGDCREVLPAAVRWDGLVSPEGFREVRWACRDNGANAAMFPENIREPSLAIFQNEACPERPNDHQSRRRSEKGSLCERVPGLIHRQSHDRSAALPRRSFHPAWSTANYGFTSSVLLRVLPVSA